MSTALIVSAHVPEGPYQLADVSFIAALEQLEAEVRDHKITDSASDHRAVEMQTTLTKTGNALDEYRLSFIRPLDAAKRAINAAADAPLNRIALAKQVLKQARVRYDDQQRRIAAELERARQAEIARLEKIRQDELARLEALRKKEEAEAARIAKEADDRRIAEEKRVAAEKEAARIAGLPIAPEPEVLDFEEEAPEPVKTETEKAIEALQFAPPVVAPVAVAVKSKGSYFKTTLRIVSTNPKDLPEQFVIREANLKAIRAVFCDSWKEGHPIPSVPGVVFEAVKDSITR